MITRNDVAKLAGVSPTTVSYVINNGPRPVSPETRAKVLQAIEALNYTPSAVARNLRMQRTSILGLIVPDTQNPYFAELTRGVEWIAFENNYTIMICHSGYQFEREMQYVDMLLSQRVAGVIWIPATSNFEAYEKLLENSIPTIVVDRLKEDHYVPNVVAENFRGGYIATQHLIRLGHTRIGIIARPVDLSHSQDRVSGYKAALMDNGLTFTDELCAPGGYWLEHGWQAFHQLMQIERPPTAVFAYNDIMAIGALRAAHELSLRVPEDISIVGFDDISSAAFTCPSLTTVRQDKFGMGAKSTELLLQLIDSDESRSSMQYKLDVELVIRESTGRVPGRA